ncbi:OmpA family protein [Cellulomonas sp. PhB150]|uniref:OmpA family protein n=1 Tax=Cellulomonas sp. PhB150 TaxID=2485188 RepID=UPI000F490AC8|nr:OmpA family protein [Cellulomonas sp. PhB150]ROS26194.1 OmpA family protein [Cellulomonas sp. PhB150]
MRRSLRTAALAAALVLVAPTAATAADDVLTLDDLPPITDGMLTSLFNVRTYDNLTGILTTRTYDPTYAVKQLGDVSTGSGETVVTLASDILFTSDSDKLSANAKKRIGQLVDDVPKSATLHVDGHTDSVDTPSHNQALSERRAKAVAAAVADARPDLDLEVRGYGESKLKESESGDDVDAARAANRRVELRYEGSATPSPTATATTSTTAPTGSAAVRAVPTWEGVLADTMAESPDVPGAKVRVGVESVVVRGNVMQVSVLVEQVGGAPARAHDLVPGLSRPLVVDRENLVQYSVLSNTGQTWSTDQLGTVDLVAGAPTRFVATFPAPVAPASAVDVIVTPGSFELAGVPVTTAS